MKVHIEDNLYLESDEMQYILKRYTGKTYKDKNGKEIEAYDRLGNWASIHSVLKAVMVMKIKESTATTLQDLYLDIGRIEAWIKAKFETELKEGERVAV